MILVVTAAYGASSPEFSVAEFAPSAQRSLDAPPTTGGESKTGSAGGRRATTTTAPSAASATTGGPDGSGGPPTTTVGRGRRCFGTPPYQTQTEDPLSIACQPTMFEGDNGGATSVGVTATEIRVAVPAWQGFGSSTSIQTPVLNAFFDYMNSRYELYGRRLVPVVVEGSAWDATTNRAQAEAVVATKSFAAITGPMEWGGNLTAGFATSLARGKVVTVARSASWWWSDQVVYDPLHPYVWSIYPSAEDVQANVADFSCTALAGREASHTDDAVMKEQTRKFGILALARNSVPATSMLSKKLAECTGEQPQKIEWATGTPGNDVMRNGLTKFKDAGVTTVICICEAYETFSGIYPAKQLSYRPEWLLLPSAYMTGNDEYPLQYNRRNNELAPPMRMSAGPRVLPLQARPWYAALAATNPKVFETTDKYGLLGMGEFIYDQLQVLASGIQAAGPTLNPDTFAAGMMTAQFPNPGAGQAPSWQPSVGFGPGDHSFYDDYTVAGWSDTAKSYDYPASPYDVGSWCYLGAGARFRVGNYPADADARLFNPSEPCR